MSYALCYAVLMLLWLVFGVVNGAYTGLKAAAPDIIAFLLFPLLGLAVFGPLIHR